MIYKIERTSAELDDFEGMTFGGNVYINTQNIVSIEKYWDDSFEQKSEYSICSGLIINGIKTPLFLLTQYKDDDRIEHFEKLYKADKSLERIFLEIIEIMKKEG